jgi:hypothetical protein
MKRKKNGSAEIMAAIYTPFIIIVIIAFVLFIKISRYDYFLEATKSDLETRLRKQYQIYKYDNFEEIQSAFEDIKKEYSEDYITLSNSRLFSKKIAKQLIMGMEIEQMTFEDGTNLKDGFYFYRVNMKDISVDVIWMNYKPNKPGYIIFPKEEEM